MGELTPDGAGQPTATAAKAAAAPQPDAGAGPDYAPRTLFVPPAPTTAAQQTGQLAEDAKLAP